MAFYFRTLKRVEFLIDQMMLWTFSIPILEWLVSNGSDFAMFLCLLLVELALSNLISSEFRIGVLDVMPKAEMDVCSSIDFKLLTDEI